MNVWFQLFDRCKCFWASLYLEGTQMKQALVNALVADVASGISLVASSFGVATW